MPYTGKPSYGCDECKRRHVKCDETRPACTACVKGKRACPGYRDKLDTVIRSQNDAVRLAVERRTRKVLARRREGDIQGKELKVPSPNFATSNSLDVPISQRATCFFWKNYIVDLTLLDTGTIRGFLAWLPPLYEGSQPGEPLFLATEAAALALFGAWHARMREAESEYAKESFGKALVATQKAVLDPVECRTDRTLMTVLMLGFYETLTRKHGLQPESRKHIEGAIALVKHRGLRTFDTEISKRLLVAVRGQNIDDGAVDQELWDESIQVPQNPATHLDNLLKDTLGMTPEDADAHLSTWPQSIPDSWHPVRVQSSVESYNGCDVYPDLIIMGHYNSWRCQRIKLGLAVQEMVDGICASVPFMIGDRQGPAALGEPGTKYPHLEDSPTSQAHYRVASAKGGWYLIGPLMLILGSKVQLREGQRDWVWKQMERLQKIYDIRSR